MQLKSEPISLFLPILYYMDAERWAAGVAEALPVPPGLLRFPDAHRVRAFDR